MNRAIAQSKTSQEVQKNQKALARNRRHRTTRAMDPESPCSGTSRTSLRWCSTDGPASFGLQKLCQAVPSGGGAFRLAPLDLRRSLNSQTLPTSPTTSRRSHPAERTCTKPPWPALQAASSRPRGTSGKPPHRPRLEKSSGRGSSSLDFRKDQGVRHFGVLIIGILLFSIRVPYCRKLPCKQLR